MAKQRIFISFDYDNDEDIKIMLAGQAKLPDSPFDFTDGSIKEHLTGDWKEKAKKRIRNCDQMIVLCGTATHAAKGVSAELEIAQELGTPYFLLWGRSEKTCSKPGSAKTTDKIYNWTWANLKSLIGGSR
ncbi:MAG TPA: TIR domain-containing protein [Candidatus Binatia bacterium]|nr:TIR domain-containing protein [Candidatus Binatia bacterium]